MNKRDEPQSLFYNDMVNIGRINNFENPLPKDLLQLVLAVLAHTSCFLASNES